MKQVETDQASDRATALILGDPKTESSTREIPLPHFLSKLIHKRMKTTHAKLTDFVFENSHGTAANPRTIQKRFTRLMDKLQIRGAHIHTLRHTFAMRCLERGMGYKALSEILGHSSSAVTIKCYDNCTVESKEKGMRSARMVA